MGIYSLYKVGINLTLIICLTLMDVVLGDVVLAADEDVVPVDEVLEVAGAGIFLKRI